MEENSSIFLMKDARLSQEDARLFGKDARLFLKDARLSTKRLKHPKKTGSVRLVNPLE